MNSFGLVNKGSNYRTLKERFISEDIDYEQFKKDTNIYRPISTKRTNEELFVSDPKIKRDVVKNRIIKDKLLPYICDICGQEPIWKGKPLVLILDHINGISYDHRLENLRFVCPNCNAQLDTHSGKHRNQKLKDSEKIKITRSQKKYIKRIKESKKLCIECQKPISKGSTSGLCRDCLNSKKEKPYNDIKVVYEMVQENGYKQTGAHYGVSDNAVRKWFKKEGLEDPLKDKWEKNFRALIAFYRKNNSLPEQKSSLGKWVLSLRFSFKEGSLSEERIKRLNEITVRILLPVSVEAVFKERKESFKAFVAEHRKNPSINATNPEEKSLAIWNKNQKAKKK